MAITETIAKVIDRLLKREPRFTGRVTAWWRFRGGRCVEGQTKIHRSVVR